MNRSIRSQEDGFKITACTIGNQAGYQESHNKIAELIHSARASHINRAIDLGWSFTTSAGILQYPFQIQNNGKVYWTMGKILVEKRAVEILNLRR